MQKYTQTISNKKFAPFTEKNKNIIIHFDEIFNNPELEVFNVFKMSVGKKRVYATFANTICKDNNKLLSGNYPLAQKVVFSYLTIKKAIDKQLFVKIDSDSELQNYGADAKRDFGKYENFINFMIN